ncbi:MAG: hypothetical protein AB8G23_02660 [Myxococcota bacterium]
MSIRSSIQKIFRSLLVAGFLTTSFTVASTAQATLMIDYIPASVCKSTQLPWIGDKTQYDGGGIKTLPSDSLWDYDIVVCPINRFNPDGEILQMRVHIEGENARNSWCQLYNAADHDRDIDFKYTTSTGHNRGMVTFLPANPNFPSGQIAVTARCLLFPGDTLTHLDVFWDY